jgi:hypothetical protein
MALPGLEERRGWLVCWEGIQGTQHRVFWRSERAARHHAAHLRKDRRMGREVWVREGARC